MTIDYNLKTNVVLISGSDISSVITCNLVVQSLKSKGINVLLCDTGNPRNSPKSAKDVQVLHTHERRILPDCVRPFLLKNDAQTKGKFVSLEDFDVRYEIPVLKSRDINDPIVREIFKLKDVKIGVSVRCYQKFGPHIIEYFDSKNCLGLWNMHPGKLPEYRGVTTIARAMANSEKLMYGTLHLINNRWDAGPILDARSYPIDYGRSVLWNYVSLSAIAAELIAINVLSALSTGAINSRKQDESAAAYYTHPNNLDIKQFTRKGFCLFSIEDSVEIFSDAFSSKKGCEKADLEDEIFKFLTT